MEIHRAPSLINVPRKLKQDSEPPRVVLWGMRGKSMQYNSTEDRAWRLWLDFEPTLHVALEQAFIYGKPEFFLDTDIQP